MPFGFPKIEIPLFNNNLQEMSILTLILLDYISILALKFVEHFLIFEGIVELSEIGIL